MPAQARREVGLIQAGEVEIIATALVQPSTDIENIKARDAEVEHIAVEMTIAYEAARGAEVRDVSTPEKARVAGLTDHAGFDVFSKRSDGEKRPIEVKGRVGVGDVELTENEWAKAINLRERYWLYVVFQCDSWAPRLFRVRDPFGKLIARSVLKFAVSAGQIIEVAEV